ncbi:hypothetical protein Droror1_Dr00022005 [Drosera rotundifolia]
MFQILQKLKNLRSDFKKIHQDGFSNMDARVMTAEQELLKRQEELRLDYTNEKRALIVNASNAYEPSLIFEEEYLKQLLKDQWFFSIDRNNRYFYDLLNNRKNKKQILELKMRQGFWFMRSILSKLNFLNSSRSSLGHLRGTLCRLMLR